MCKDFKEKCNGKVHRDMRRLQDSGRIRTGGGGDHIDPSPVNIGLIPLSQYNDDNIGHLYCTMS